jgi:hypothetical protein
VSSDFIVIACVGLQGQQQVRLAQGAPDATAGR